MRLVPNIRLLAILLLTVALVYPPEIFADGIVKRVVFGKGKSSAAYRGKLPKQFDYDAYVLRARKSQVLSVKLISDDAEGFLAIYETQEYGPDEDTILEYGERRKEWSGRLPITSEYSVQVYDASENGVNRAPYTIEISIR